MQIFITLFFGVFVAWGGIMLGSGVRAWRAGQQGGGASMRIGVLIGGVTLLVGSAITAQMNNWSATVLWIAFPILVLGSAFIPQQTLGELGAGTFVAIGLGAVVTTMGALVAREAFNNSDVLFGLAWAGCAGFVGLGFLLTGIGALLRGQRLVMRQKAPGEYELAPEDQADDEAEAKKPYSNSRKRKKH